MPATRPREKGTRITERAAARTSSRCHAPRSWGDGEERPRPESWARGARTRGSLAGRGAAPRRRGKTLNTRNARTRPTGAEVAVWESVRLRPARGAGVASVFSRPRLQSLAKRQLRHGIRHGERSGTAARPPSGGHCAGLRETRGTWWLLSGHCSLTSAKYSTDLTVGDLTCHQTRRGRRPAPSTAAAGLLRCGDAPRPAPGGGRASPRGAPSATSSHFSCLQSAVGRPVPFASSDELGDEHGRRQRVCFGAERTEDRRGKRATGS